jgi:hypothetical protein
MSSHRAAYVDKRAGDGSVSVSLEHEEWGADHGRKGMVMSPINHDGSC